MALFSITEVCYYQGVIDGVGIWPQLYGSLDAAKAAIEAAAQDDAAQDEDAGEEPSPAPTFEEEDAGLVGTIGDEWEGMRWIATAVLPPEDH